MVAQPTAMMVKMIQNTRLPIPGVGRDGAVERPAPQSEERPRPLRVS